jgi:wyosine [tRNA(Phe)-imidazoG37] synthetase (radical SAM superfamily)
VGKTIDRQIERVGFYGVEEILRAVKEKVTLVSEQGEAIDYLSFVPDGEPTLDINLGAEIELLKPLGIKVAVITNASLIWREDVRRDLSKADWVSLKVDAVSDEIWHRVSRPHESLELDSMLEGIRRFADGFRGELTTETMLIGGLNDSSREIEGIVDFLTEIKPSIAYLAVPIRPPAEKMVVIPEETVINMAYQTWAGRLDRVECLLGEEEDTFILTGNVEDDLLSITSVHPMRSRAVRDFLSRANVEWDVVDKLVAGGRLVELCYQGERFYLRKLPQSDDTA